MTIGEIIAALALIGAAVLVACLLRKGRKTKRRGKCPTCTGCGKCEKWW